MPRRDDIVERLMTAGLAAVTALLGAGIAAGWALTLV